jgi:hypothetical protein
MERHSDGRSRGAGAGGMKHGTGNVSKRGLCASELH